MKVLWVKADKLLPVNNGGNIRSYHLLKHLAQRHELTFLSYYGGAPDPQYQNALKAELPGSVVVCTGKREVQGAARAWDYAMHLPAHAPYAVARFRARAVQELIRKWFRERRFDVAVCDFLDAAINFPEDIEIPSVLFQHNVESEIWRRHAITETNGLRKRIYGLEFRKMFQYERKTIRRFDHVIAVSENDRRLMTGWVDGSRITVVPTGVDLRQFQPVDGHGPTYPLVVFTGAMDWEPNVDAVEYFCSEIWPAVLAKIPGARFRIVGRNPDQRVRKLVGATVEVTGSVPSIVDHLGEAATVVVPLRIGGGTRLKIYEAMAMGKAVVSTSVGAEGLAVHDGTDIVLADSAPQFAAAIVKLLTSEGSRVSLERAAAQLAARYDWAVVSESFAEVLAGVVAGSQPGNARAFAFQH
ncbi:MAG TPA: glycosyltransferase [Terriglobales bacterium]